MQSLAKIICLFLLIGFSTICWATKTDPIRLTNKSLEIKAYITPEFRNFNGGKSKIVGKITITNQTATIQKYGNKFLKLIVNRKLTSRTYKDTITSDAVDFTVVEIKPHSSLTLAVYWVFEVQKETTINSLQLSLDDEGIEKAKNIISP